MSNEELMKINGGVSKWIIYGIGGTIIFLIGVIDGYLRPLKCN